jgi:hypothetical protein
MMELFLAQWGTWYALRAADMLRLPAKVLFQVATRPKEAPM